MHVNYECDFNDADSIKVNSWRRQLMTRRFNSGLFSSESYCAASQFMINRTLDCSGS